MSKHGQEVRMLMRAERLRFAKIRVAKGAMELARLQGIRVTDRSTLAQVARAALAGEVDLDFDEHQRWLDAQLEFIDEAPR